MTDSDTRTAWHLFQLNWIPILAMGDLLALGLGLTGLRLEAVSFGVTLTVAAVLVAIVARHRRLHGDRADPKLVFSLGSVAQIIIACAVVGPLSYVVGKIDWPLQDQALLAIDRAFGLHPEPIIGFVNDHPWLAERLSAGYGMIKWFLLAIPVVLALTARYVRLQLFMLAMSIALAVTIAISAFVPAIGTYYVLQMPAAHIPHVNTAIYAGQLRDILSLRDGSLHELKLFGLSGIISFPSFHAASAVLYMWALWPVRRIGGLSVGINLLMLAATPVIGAHYMIDVAGGIGVSVLSIWAAKRYLERAKVATPAQSAPAWQPSLAK